MIEQASCTSFPNEVRFENNAIVALHEAYEAYQISLYEDTNLECIHRKRYSKTFSDKIIHLLPCTSRNGLTMMEMIPDLPLEIQKCIWNLYMATVRKACFLRQLTASYTHLTLPTNSGV